MNDEDEDEVIMNYDPRGDLWKSDSSDGGCSSLTILNFSQRQVQCTCTCCGLSVGRSF